ncbi:MAG: type 4a pilus biogenesis protein PilO [Akkermansiaceae bacterium]|nr:type 4a pilus biogenesis protein PilO [Armatimonadota bacterium]
MIDFKRRDDILPSSLILAAILMLLGTLLYMVLVPTPSTAGLAKGRDLSRRKIAKEIETARARADELEKTNRAYLWNESAESVTARVLGDITAQARRKSLKMTAFRPQRPQTLETLTELPFSVQLSGPYPAVRDVVAAMNTPRSRIALRSLQMASSDGASSAVTATVAFSAYTVLPKKPAAKSTPRPAVRGGNANG